MSITANGSAGDLLRSVVINGHPLRVRADGTCVERRTPAGWLELEQVADRWHKGYLRVRLPGGRTVAVHKLVALAWHGPPTPAHRLVKHADGSRRNNDKDNVRWATHTDNLTDAFRLRERAVKYSIKLGEALVYEIRTRRHRAEIAVLADELGTGEQTIRDVFDGRTWKRVRADQGRIPGTV